MIKIDWQWQRLPSADAAGTTSTDTTEVEIGNITVPNWANSLVAVHCHLVSLALTSDEEVGGYFRIVNDDNTIDPLNFSIPISQQLAGAQGGHLSLPVTFPAFSNLTANDTLRAYAALDAATTGAHTIQVYVLFSRSSVPYQMHGEKSAVIAGSATANTAAGSATLATQAGKTSALIGIGHYIQSGGGVTAAQTSGGYIKVSSSADGWVEQRLPTNVLPSGLGTDVPILSLPMYAITKKWKEYLSGVSTIPISEFPVSGKEDFTIVNYQDGTNTASPSGRYFLYWRE